MQTAGKIVHRKQKLEAQESGEVQFLKAALIGSIFLTDINEGFVFHEEYSLYHSDNFYCRMVARRFCVE
jgi:hypothetical protein